GPAALLAAGQRPPLRDRPRRPRDTVRSRRPVVVPSQPSTPARADRSAPAARPAEIAGPPRQERPPPGPAVWLGDDHALGVLEQAEDAGRGSEVDAGVVDGQAGAQ